MYIDTECIPSLEEMIVSINTGIFFLYMLMANTFQRSRDEKSVIDYLYNYYHPVTKNILEENRYAKVQHIELCRTVLSDNIFDIIDFFMQGELKQRMKTPLCHISICVKLSNGKTIRVEKIPVIYLKENPIHKGKTHKVKNLQDITFGELLEKTRREVGDRDFFSYSVTDNNCSHFIGFILKANGLSTPENQLFIYQNIHIFVNGYESLHKMINAWMDLVRIISYLYSIKILSIASKISN